MKKRLKTMAMYLPQFHCIPENDEWWGKGFTEWTTVKAAERLFSGHAQPRVPLNGYYYDLLKKETMEWQAGLANKYGIDGFCFYHYYFKEGKKVLEKPMENLLMWKDINISYCCCWANQTWARTWSKLYDANSWSEKFEPEKNNSNPVLLEQEYGGQVEWEVHFEYLLPFFLDERYIKIENKPVFLIYMPEDIQQLSKMMECWNAKIQRYGFDGVYVIGVNCLKALQGMSARLFQGPNAYRIPLIAGKNAKVTWREGVEVFDYQDCWDNAVSFDVFDTFKTYYGGFVDYDNTPRRGNLGVSAEGVAPTVFGENLYRLSIKNIILGNQWLFINAWNEWGEGNYLEPDERNKFGYLEKVRNVMEKCNDEQLDVKKEWENICASDSQSKDTTELLKMVDKYRELYRVLNRWLTLKEHNINLEDYFLERGICKVLIYGMAELGKHLYEELCHSRIEVAGALDRRQGINYKGLKVYNSQEKFPICDAVIVTAVSDRKEIKAFLDDKVNIPVLFLKDIIYALAQSDDNRY